MNSETISHQINEYNSKENLHDNEDYSILLKITTKEEDCNAKSPLYLQIKDFFHQRCSAFKKKEFYIGGICKLNLAELFNEISAGSFMKYNNIINVNISLYYFFEDIMNDLDDVKPNSITYNLSKKEEKEKKQIKLIIKDIRREYQKLTSTIS